MLIAFMELKNIKKEISTLNVANKDKKKAVSCRHCEE